MRGAGRVEAERGWKYERVPRAWRWAGQGKPNLGEEKGVRNAGITGASKEI